ncbi:MAG: peptidoglycan DD-metalloendopeptidase family protein [Anaerolineaceae bacterium]|nr:peptidoglycan DD-metalloendopeptidase family protein [Anaerolineaceae bacterium]
MSLQPNQQDSKGLSAGSSRQRWISRLLWAVAIASMIYMTVLLTSRAPVSISAAFNPDENFGMPQEQAIEEVIVEEEIPISLPPLQNLNNNIEISRSTNIDTTIPERSRDDVIVYRVEAGDAIFRIAGKYDLKPESVLWANYDSLNDDPQMIEIGLALYIPPVDGILYKWEEGDTLEDVSDRYYVDVGDIISWPGNKLDMTNPEITPGSYVMVPGGWRPTQTWVVPTIWQANAGANKSIAGGCAIPDAGYVGSGGFVWPANNHYLSGNDFWSGHLGIDVAAGTGAPIYAADSGVVVYAAGISGGYGNMVMIDHGNGYHTVYAHLNSINVYCGQNVMQGSLIGLAGSTGRSTGPHLHFEIRLNGEFINPWYVLP